jgi:hypothetical protein
MNEIDKLLDKLAIEAAVSVLAEERGVPGSQDLVNLEAAREILWRAILSDTGTIERSDCAMRMGAMCAADPECVNPRAALL